MVVPTVCEVAAIFSYVSYRYPNNNKIMIVGHSEMVLLHGAKEFSSVSPGGRPSASQST